MYGMSFAVFGLCGGEVGRRIGWAARRLPVEAHEAARRQAGLPYTIDIRPYLEVTYPNQAQL